MKLWLQCSTPDEAQGFAAILVKEPRLKVVVQGSRVTWSGPGNLQEEVYKLLVNGSRVVVASMGRGEA